MASVQLLQREKGSKHLGPVEETPSEQPEASSEHLSPVCLETSGGKTICSELKAKLLEVKPRPLMSRRREDSQGTQNNKGWDPERRKPGMQGGVRASHERLASSRKLILAVTFRKDLEVLEGSQSK